MIQPSDFGRIWDAGLKDVILSATYGMRATELKDLILFDHLWHYSSAATQLDAFQRLWGTSTVSNLLIFLLKASTTIRPLLTLTNLFGKYTKTTEKRILRSLDSFKQVFGSITGGMALSCSNHVFSPTGLQLLITYGICFDRESGGPSTNRMDLRTCS